MFQVCWNLHCQW